MYDEEFLVSQNRFSSTSNASNTTKWRPVGEAKESKKRGGMKWHIKFKKKSDKRHSQLSVETGTAPNPKRVLTFGQHRNTVQKCRCREKFWVLAMGKWTRESFIQTIQSPPTLRWAGKGGGGGARWIPPGLEGREWNEWWFCGWGVWVTSLQGVPGPPWYQHFSFFFLGTDNWKFLIQLGRFLFFKSRQKRDLLCVF